MALAGLILFAYLLGSVPTSVWIGKIFFGIDVRNYGSGNAGATNTFRVLGRKAGIPVLLFDVFKGWLPVFLVGVFKNDFFIHSDLYILKICVGIAAVLGHIFPLYAGFRGKRSCYITRNCSWVAFPIRCLQPGNFFTGTDYF